MRLDRLNKRRNMLADAFPGSPHRRCPGIFHTISLASAWLVVTGMIALAGLSRLLKMSRNEARPLATLTTIAGMFYLPVGAVWLVMSRGGIQPLGFGDTIVLLTAVHFHFAGFAAPVLTGLAGKYMTPTARLRKVFFVAAICVIAGTPLVAAGITVSPATALAGAIVFTIGLIALVLINLLSIVPKQRGLSKLLLIVSSLACLPAMALACVYAYSIVFHKLIIDIPQMAFTHGLANSFGFALCGLVAWLLMATDPREVQSFKFKVSSSQ